MQSGLFIEVLVLQSEGLVRVDRPSRPFSDAPKRRIRSTTTDCRGWSVFSRGMVYRLGRSGSRGLLADFSVFVDGVSIGETACVRTAHTLRRD